MFSREASNCKPVIPAAVNWTDVADDEEFGMPPPAIKVILELTTPWMSSAGGGNAGAA